MNNGLYGVPGGWVTARKGARHFVGAIIGALMLFTSTFGLALALAAHSFLLGIQTTLLVVISTFLVYLTLADRGKDPGAYVKLFPNVLSVTSGTDAFTGRITSIASAFMDLELVADPNGPRRLVDYTSRWVFSDGTDAKRFLTIEHLPQQLVMIGVSGQALDLMPRVESLFQSEGRMGTFWEIPSLGWEGMVTLMGCVMAFLSLPLVMIISYDGPTLLAFVYLIVLAIPIAAILFNHRTDRLVVGTARKHLSVNIEDIIDALSRASMEMGFRLESIDDEIPLDRALLTHGNDRIVALLKADGADLTVVLTRHILKGAVQGYTTVHIARYFSTDEVLAKRFMRSVDAALGRSVADFLARFFFDGTT